MARESTSVVDPIMRELRSRGYWLIKIHGSNFQLAGIPDIIGCTPEGHFFGLECKTGNDKPSPLQAYCLEELRKYGAIAACVHSLEEALAALSASTSEGEQMCAVKDRSYAEVVVSDHRYEQAMKVVRATNQRVSEDDAMNIIMELGWDDAISYDPQGHFQLTLTRLQWVAYAAALASAIETGRIVRDYEGSIA